jgi:hypothetical protein
MVLAPGHPPSLCFGGQSAHLHAIKSCTLTTFWLRDRLYRDTAQVPATSFVTGDKFAAPIKLVPRHSYNSQNVYLDGKKCAIPSLHRDSFSAKEPGLCPVLSSGNVPPRQAGSIAKTAHWAVSIRSAPLYCRAVRQNKSL